jgi:8-oxo-dGTP pyrophosphatase MutT (NUDIX family)
MPVPDFVLRLRSKIGHDLLPMSGATGVVLDGDRLLLGRRADTGGWSLPSGILEPGEQPATGVLREILEETGVVAAVEALTSTHVQPPVVYPGGDQAQYLDLTFRCRYVSGLAHVADDESLEVAWFDLSGLPELSTSSRFKLDRALEFTGTTWFEGLDDRVAPDTAHRS